MFLAALLLTLRGSIVTGWHYAVDACVGGLLAAVSFVASRRVSLHLSDPEESPPSKTPLQGVDP